VSCGGFTPRPVNPERPGEAGKWVRPPRPASRSATCIHRWQYRNALGIVGGPGVQECLRCGESHYSVWVPAPVAAALPPTFLVGEAEWADVHVHVHPREAA
jgi:hypothetical protein